MTDLFWLCSPYGLGCFRTTHGNLWHWNQWFVCHNLSYWPIWVLHCFHHWLYLLLLSVLLAVGRGATLIYMHLHVQNSNTEENVRLDLGPNLGPNLQLVATVYLSKFFLQSVVSQCFYSLFIVNVNQRNCYVRCLNVKLIYCKTGLQSHTLSVISC